MRAERVMDHRAANGRTLCIPQTVLESARPVRRPVWCPLDTHQLDWELELGVVMGRRARRASQARALDYVAGHVVANDISARRPYPAPLTLSHRRHGLGFCKGGPGRLRPCDRSGSAFRSGSAESYDHVETQRRDWPV